MPANSANPAPTFWGNVKDVLAKIWDVVKWIFVAIIGTLLFLANPTLFAIGFVCGIAFDEKFKEVSDKVVRIYQESRWELLAIIGFGAFLSPAVTAGVMATGFGGALGRGLVVKGGGGSC